MLADHEAAQVAAAERSRNRSPLYSTNRIPRLQF
jgi:hypothetical protein